MVSELKTGKHGRKPKLLQDSQRRSLRLFRKKEHRHLDITLIMLDVGMVTVLSEKDRRNLMHMIKYLVLRDEEKCALFMKKLCSYRDSPGPSDSENLSRNLELYDPINESFDRDMDSLFTELNKLPLHKISVGGALREIFNAITSNRMRVEGNFASLLSSLLILEGMACELDPKANVVGSTIPFLLNSEVKSFMASTSESNSEVV